MCVQSKSNYYCGRSRLRCSTELQNVGFSNTQKTVLFTVEMLISSFFCFALLHCAYGVAVPQFIQASLPHVMVISANVGDSIELDCSSDGYPHLEALWYKYNIPLLDITYRKLEETLKFRKLVLNNLLLADAGNYSCWVKDKLGSIINRTFLLYVYETSNTRPMILKSLMTNKTTVLGSESSFHCRVASESVTYVRWYFKRCAVQGNTSSNSTRATVTEISSLVPVKISSFVGNGLNGHLFKGESVFLVKNVSLHDEGEYICEAFNEHGRIRWGAFLVVVKAPTPSAHEIEARYAAMFGKTQDLPLPVLVAVPVAVLIILTAVFIRALEKAKQQHGVGLVKKTDMNGDAGEMSESYSDKESTNQKMEQEFVITEPRRISNYFNHNGVQIGQQITQLSKQVTCPEVTCSSERLPSSQGSDVSSKRCSAALELEWEGIELVMEDGFEMIKLCKEEEV